MLSFTSFPLQVRKQTMSIVIPDVWPKVIPIIHGKLFKFRLCYEPCLKHCYNILRRYTSFITIKYYKFNFLILSISLNCSYNLISFLNIKYIYNNIPVSLLINKY